MPTVTADKVVGHDLYAKTSVKGYTSDLHTIKQTFSPNQRIGNIYSWYEGPDGNLYWEIFTSDADYQNFNPTFVRHVTGTLDVPDLPDILAQIDAEKKAAEIAQKGLLQYYLDQYLPYIVGGVFIALVLPSVLSSGKKAVSGKDKNDTTTILLLGGGALLAYYLFKKKSTGSVEVGPLDQGSYGTDSVQTGSNQVAQVANANSGRLSFVGPFQAQYDPAGTVNGRKKVRMSGLPTIA